MKLKTGCMSRKQFIRKATLEDAEAIQSITKEAFLEDIKKDIETKEVFIAIIDDVPVGTIRVQILPDNTAYISRFGVRLQYHNMGVGKAMMSLVDKLLISKGVKRVRLHTASKYAELMRFYYGRGFYVDSTSRERGYIRALLVKDYE